MIPLLKCIDGDIETVVIFDKGIVKVLERFHRQVPREGIWSLPPTTLVRS